MTTDKTNPYATHKPPAAGSGLYLKLEDGQTVNLRIASEAYVFQSKFVRGDEEKWSTRYAWVIYNNDESRAQVLQLSPTTFKQIAAYATDPEYGDPTEYNIKLTREGTGTDTVYSVIASPKPTPFTTDMGKATRLIDITEVKGLEHAVPISQLLDGTDAPKGPEEEPVFSGGSYPEQKPPKTKDVVIEDLSDDSPVNLDEIPF